MQRARPIFSLAIALVTFKAQSLFPHASYFFLELRILFIELRALRFQRIAPAGQDGDKRGGFERLEKARRRGGTTLVPGRSLEE